MIVSSGTESVVRKVISTCVYRFVDFRHRLGNGEAQSAPLKMLSEHPTFALNACTESLRVFRSHYSLYVF